MKKTGLRKMQVKKNGLPLLCTVLLCIAVLSAPLRATDGQTPSKPNILFILGDDVGRELLACYGGESGYRTPRLEELAASGMRFENCYATPLCSPSRIELLSGRYSFRNYTNWCHLGPRQLTFAQLLRDAGYATAIAGKWQLRGWDESPPRIVQAGFQDYCAYVNEEEAKEFASPLGNQYWGGMYMSNGVAAKLDRYGDDVFTDMLVQFMKRNREKPFLAYYCMGLMHRPFQPTPEHPEAPHAGQPAPESWMGLRGQAENFGPMLGYADRLVGKLLDALKELGLEQNTIVIFTGDNGTDNKIEASKIRSKFMGQEVRGGKYFPTELGVNVPLLVRWPGRVNPGSVSRTLVDFTDILPTFADAAGAKLPPDYALDGRSFVPVLLGRAQAPKEFIYSWGNFEGNSKKYKEPQLHQEQWLHVVRDGQWKLYSDGRMFDTQSDFLEGKPVAPGTQPEADAARARLMEQLERLRKTQPRIW